MGLKCSILGHAYEPAGVEREREERGSEVVTVVRELERCTRCGADRVVSENTEVTAVVDADDVEVEGDAPGGGIGGAVERSGATDDGDDDETPDDDRAADAAAAVDELAERPEYDPAVDADIDPEDPEQDDAEILTDDPDDEREPGQWPDDPEGSQPDGTDEDRGDERGAPARGDDAPDDGVDHEAGREIDPDPEQDDPTEESLSGITVPEGRIVCPDCEFDIEAHSGYREGDPCPDCGSWLEAERNP